MMSGIDLVGWKCLGEDPGPGMWFWNPKTGAVAYAVEEGVLELYEVLS